MMSIFVISHKDFRVLWRYISDRDRDAGLWHGNLWAVHQQPRHSEKIPPEIKSPWALHPWGKQKPTLIDLLLLHDDADDDDDDWCRSGLSGWRSSRSMSWRLSWGTWSWWLFWSGSLIRSRRWELSTPLTFSVWPHPFFSPPVAYSSYPSFLTLHTNECLLSLCYVKEWVGSSFLYINKGRLRGRLSLLSLSLSLPSM